MPSRLRLERLQKELSQYQLERRTGIAQARLSLLERGFRVPTVEEQAKLADALGCSVEEIRTEDWPQEPDSAQAQPA